MARPFKCPFCGSMDNVNKGVRKTKTMGLRKIRRCKSCGRKFTPRYQQALAEEGNPADMPLTTEVAIPAASEPTSETNEDNGRTTQSMPQDS